jgi:glycosyltransferase involved in cell wall biosynthesis/peptidoglycan/xylan/chitin deacetylase (PgdA/CDA1 family)
MRVCVLGLRGLPHVMGGVETHCEQLFPRMKELHPDDSFTIIGRKWYLPKEVSEYHGLRIISLPHARGRHFETITNTILGVLYARFALHAELIHLHGIGPALTAPVARALGLRVVVTYHSKNYEHHKWNRVARFILRIGELCAVTFGDRVIVVSQCLATDLKRRFPKTATKIYFIPNGATQINTAQLAALREHDVLARYGLDKNKYIISIGRLVPEKGFHDLCRAFRTSDLDCKLLIVGDADHRDEYSKRLVQQASDTIVFTGFIPQDRLQILLKNASLFVLPSYNEGLPIAALEAVGAGTPVLLSDIEPNRDLGFRTENYFRVGDVDDLRRKISQAHQLYCVDRDKTLQRYNWDTVAAETTRVYSTLQAHGHEGKPSSLSLKHRAFNSGFGTLAAVGADRWLRFLAQGRGVILMFHHVRPWQPREFAPNRGLEITPEFLDIVLTELQQEGFEIITLDAVLDRARSGAAAGRPFAALTFDDGYRDNVEHAWPVLRRHNAPWTLFVTTDFADGRGRLWWLELEQAIARLDRIVLRGSGELRDLPSRTILEKRAAFETIYRHLRDGPEERLRAVTSDLAAQADVDTHALTANLCLGWDELQTLVREPDVLIGAHTLSHPILAKCNGSAAMREIAESKAVLERRLGRPVRHLAYPFGDATAAGPREFQLARQAGYTTAITSRPAHVFPEHAAHPHALPRTSINGLFQNTTALRALLSGVPFLIWNHRRILKIEH